MLRLAELFGCSLKTEDRQVCPLQIQASLWYIIDENCTRSYREQIWGEYCGFLESLLRQEVKERTSLQLLTFSGKIKRPSLLAAK
jgi:hypothetical protein